MEKALRSQPQVAPIKDIIKIQPSIYNYGFATVLYWHHAYKDAIGDRFSLKNNFYGYIIVSGRDICEDQKERLQNYQAFTQFKHFSL